MNDRTPVARCANVSRSYSTETETVDALVDCSADFYPNAIAVISGPSGSGKSTLLRILAGLDRPTAGLVSLGGRAVEGLSSRRRLKLRGDLISYIFQKPSDNFVSFFSVADHLRLAGVRDRAAQKEILDQLELGERIDELPTTLSGGEQQRAAFAHAMAAQRPIVVADEPTAELDHQSADQVLDAMETLARAGACVLVASHDERVIGIAHSTVRLRDGRVVPPAGGPE